MKVLCSLRKGGCKPFLKLGTLIVTYCSVCITFISKKITLAASEQFLGNLKATYCQWRGMTSCDLELFSCLVSEKSDSNFVIAKSAACLSFLDRLYRSLSSLYDYVQERHGLGTVGDYRSNTLVFLPKIPFKMTQSIHVALQKNCYFDKKSSKLFSF